MKTLVVTYICHMTHLSGHMTLLSGHMTHLNDTLFQSHDLTLVVTAPACLYRSPTQADSRLDFPEPTWPTTAVSDPVGTSILILSSITVVSGNQENLPSVILKLTSVNKQHIYMYFMY